MAGLAPSEEIVAASFSVASVLAVFDAHTPDISNIRANGAQDENTRVSIMSAVLTSAAIVAGMALIARSPVVYVTGAAVIAIEGFQYFHANHMNPDSGKLQFEVA
jgi:hypothetical protein